MPESFDSRPVTSLRVKTNGRREGRLARSIPPTKGKLDPEHVAVEEQERTQRLVLRRGRDLTIHGEMGEELPDFFYSHLRWVTLPVEEDEAPDPVRVSLLGAQAQVSEARDGADAFEESGLLHVDKRASQKSVESSG